MFLAPACGGSELGGAAPGDTTTTAADADATSGDGSDGTTTTDATLLDATEVTTPDVSDAGDTSDVDVEPTAWETLSLGDVGGVSDLVIVDAHLAYAASGTRVLRWNGATWAAYGEPGGAKTVHGVWAGDDEVVAVGDDGLVARRVEGGEWETVDVGTTLDLWDVDGRGADDLWVVGDKGQVRHWDGASWSEAFAKDTLDLRSVWVNPETTGGDGVLAVGTGGQLVSKQGDAFKAGQIAAGTVTLSDVLAKDDGTLVAVGTNHTITAKRPTDPTWKGQASNDERDRDVAALALSGETLYAFGSDGLVLKQEGTVWSVVPSAAAAAALRDFATAAAFPGGNGKLLVLASEGAGVSFDGSAWTAVATHPESAVKDLESAPDGTVWAAGTLGLLMRRGSDGWSALTLPDAVRTNDLEGVAVQPDGTVWAVGAAGTIIKKAPGAAPIRVASPVPLDLFGVAASATKVVACGRGGTLIEIVDGTASVRPSGATADLRAVAFGGDGALWVAGSFGTLLRAVGSDVPALVLSGVGGSLNDLTPVATGVLAVGDNGVVLAADADGAELLNESPGVFLQGIAARGETRYAAGWNGTIVRADGATWVSEVTGTNLILEAIWLGADEALASGRQGVLLRRVEAP